MPGFGSSRRYPAVERSAWDRSSFSVASCRFLQMACPRPGAAMVGDIQNTWTLSEWNLAVRASSPRCRSAEHTSELQSLMRISYAVFCLKKKKHNNTLRTHK